MKKIRLKRPVLYGIYTGMFVIVLLALYFVDFSTAKLENTSDDLQYVSRLFGSEDVPVVSTSTLILRPYTDSNVQVVRSFYNYEGTSEEQEESITNYEQTYMQSNGVVYGGVDDGFEVISSLPGTVSSAYEDDLLGNVVTIKASDKVVITYQGLSDVSVKEGDEVNQGDVIGLSGESNMNSDLGKHVVFILMINGEYVNAEDYYDKNINEL